MGSITCSSSSERKSCAVGAQWPPLLLRAVGGHGGGGGLIGNSLARAPARSPAEGNFSPFRPLMKAAASNLQGQFLYVQHGSPISSTYNGSKLDKSSFFLPGQVYELTFI